MLWWESFERREKLLMTTRGLRIVQKLEKLAQDKYSVREKILDVKCVG